MAERHALQFDRDDSRFVYRAAGVILRDDEACTEQGRSVLLQQFAGTDFWCLPGGRIEFGESGLTAAERELREEVEPTVQVERLLWTAESFFRHGGLRYHEVGLYFLATLDPQGPAHNASEPWTAFEDDGETQMTFVWHPVWSLGSLNVLPAFLREGLRALPETPQYIVNRED